MNAIAMDIPPCSNILGFLALTCYIATLLPTMLRIVLPPIHKQQAPKWILKHRRIIGILAFLLALMHGYLLVKKRDFDFSDWQTLFVYIQGISTFTIFTLLAITSNDWSIKRLRKNWKRLHTLTYGAMFLLTWHVLDKMAGHWTYLTPIATVAIVSVSLLFLTRLWIERQRKSRGADKDDDFRSGNAHPHKSLKQSKPQKQAILTK
jgi:sulfoxide reductase heme-binding subunit YedZ